MGTADANSSKLATAHATCSTLVDAPTAQRVYAAESGVADLFGYAGCCAGRATRDVDDLPPAAPSYYRQRVAMSRAADDDPWRGGDGD